MNFLTSNTWMGKQKLGPARDETWNSGSMWVEIHRVISEVIYRVSTLFKRSILPRATTLPYPPLTLTIGATKHQDRWLIRFPTSDMAWRFIASFKTPAVPCTVYWLGVWERLRCRGCWELGEKNGEPLQSLALDSRPTNT